MSSDKRIKGIYVSRDKIEMYASMYVWTEAKLSEYIIHCSKRNVIYTYR